MTRRYNEIMAEELPKAGIACRIIPRSTTKGGVTVSASTVRRALHDGDWDTVRSMVPEPTWQFLQSAEAQPIIERIRKEKAADVVHY